jgi:predicted nuclease of predicted toxin-antitoxin system
MKFLLDQDIYAKTVSFLQNAGHNVTSVAELGLSQAIDEIIACQLSQAFVVAIGVTTSSPELQLRNNLQTAKRC